MLPCPADSTKRSRSGHFGLVGLCRRWRVHKTYATGAAPSGIPGCPEFAFWTASIDSVRMVLMQSSSSGSNVVLMAPPDCPNLRANEYLQREQDPHPTQMPGSVSGHPLDPLSTRRSRLKRIAEVLGLASHLPVSELHDAHGVRWPTVIGQDKFGNPEVARADYPPHGEAFLVRLRGARRLNVAPAADSLARLRVLEYRILSVNLVLRLEVVGVGGGPVAIQGRSNLPVFHLDFPSLTHVARAKAC